MQYIDYRTATTGVSDGTSDPDPHTAETLYIPPILGAQDGDIQLLTIASEYDHPVDPALSHPEWSDWDKIFETNGSLEQEGFPLEYWGAWSVAWTNRNDLHGGFIVGVSGGATNITAIRILIRPDNSNYGVKVSGAGTNDDPDKKWTGVFGDGIQFRSLVMPTPGIIFGLGAAHNARINWWAHETYFHDVPEGTTRIDEIGSRKVFSSAVLSSEDQDTHLLPSNLGSGVTATYFAGGDHSAVMGTSVGFYYITGIPWLRQRQRDDVVRVAGQARNNPRSIQRSIRTRQRNTYL